MDVVGCRHEGRARCQDHRGTGRFQPRVSNARQHAAAAPGSYSSQVRPRRLSTEPAPRSNAPDTRAGAAASPTAGRGTAGRVAYVDAAGEPGSNKPTSHLGIGQRPCRRGAARAAATAVGSAGSRQRSHWCTQPASLGLSMQSQRPCFSVISRTAVKPVRIDSAAPGCADTSRLAHLHARGERACWMQQSKRSWVGSRAFCRQASTAVWGGRTAGGRGLYRLRQNARPRQVQRRPPGFSFKQE